MSLLLDPQPVTLYASTGADGHGWESAPDLPLWTGQGSLQAAPGVSDALAAGGGGAGPYAPRAGAAAVLYLPPDAPVTDGLVATVAGRSYYLGRSRLVTDPTGSGDLDCYVAEATSADEWPA